MESPGDERRLACWQRKRRHRKYSDLEKTVERLLFNSVLHASSLVSRGIPQRAISLDFYDFPVNILTIQKNSAN